MIPMSDGAELAADLYHPAQTAEPPGPVPGAPDPHSLQQGRGRRGRPLLRRARATSWSPTTSAAATPAKGRWRLIADDPQDGFEVVEWIARQEWSDGKVGTFGTSYPGGTQHALAEMNPPHLTTMVPIDSVSNCGVSGMRHGGAFELRFMNWIFQIGAPNSQAALANPALQQALAESGRRIREHADSLPDPAGNDAAAGRAGIRGVAGRSDAERARVPVLAQEGDVGRRPRGRLCRRSRPAHHRLVRLVDAPGHHELPGALAKAKKSPQRLVIGPWIHGGQNSNVAGEVEFTREAGIDLLGVPAAMVRPLAERRARTASTTIRRCCSTSWAPATTVARRPAGSEHGGFWRAEREWPAAHGPGRHVFT